MLDLDLEFPDWPIIVIIQLLVNLNDLLTFLATSSLQVKGWCHSKISCLLGHLCQFVTGLSSLSSHLHAL